jgi:hypothetical protein
MKRVIVHIDRLVLKGFRPEDRHAIAEGLRVELGRRLGESAAIQNWAASGHRERVRMELTLGNDPVALGRDAGRQIAEGAKG